MALFRQGDVSPDARKALLIEQRSQLVSRMEGLQALLERLNSKIDRYEQGMMQAEKQLQRLHMEKKKPEGH